jgi:hypothetical protein
VVKVEKESFRGPDPIADRIRWYMDNYPINQVVCDAGGLGNGYILHFNDMRSLPVLAAEKREKCAYIELLNGELDGDPPRLVVDPSCLPLIGEIEILSWNDKRTDCAPGSIDHCCDAMLYGWRACTAYANEDDPGEAPAPGSKEASEMWEQDWRQKWSSGQQRKPKSYWER